MSFQDTTITIANIYDDEYDIDDSVIHGQLNNKLNIFKCVGYLLILLLTLFVYGYSLYVIIEYDLYTLLYILVASIITECLAIANHR